MRPDTVARRYARALFGIADEHGALDSVQAALETIARVLAQQSVARVLAAPVAREHKIALLRRIADETRAPSVLRDFLLLLAAHDRLGSIGGISTVFTSLLDRRRGITRASVRSAAPLAPEMLAEVTKVFGLVTGKQVVAAVQVAPELIAGVVVEVEGRVYDGSLRSQLERLHRQMATGD